MTEKCGYLWLLAFMQYNYYYIYLQFITILGSILIDMLQLYFSIYCNIYYIFSTCIYTLLYLSACCNLQHQVIIATYQCSYLSAIKLVVITIFSNNILPYLSQCCNLQHQVFIATYQYTYLQHVPIYLHSNYYI